MTNQNIEPKPFSVPEPAYEYKRIASMDLIDFSQQLQDCIKHGYELVFDNENSPVQLGTLLTCGVRKTIKDNVTNEESETSDASITHVVANTAIAPKQRKTKVTTTAT